VKIPTLIPESAGSWLRSLWRESVVNVLWKALVLAGMLVLIGTLATMGTVGGVIAFIIAASLLRDSVRTAFKDIWNRRFEEVTI